MKYLSKELIGVKAKQVKVAADEKSLIPILPQYLSITDLCILFFRCISSSVGVHLFLVTLRGKNRRYNVKRSGDICMTLIVQRNKAA